ncbi:CCA tRNA nucleotidyltransferase [Desulfotomaculum sp. 1211_IL3151]|uniref:CCA tRNA nucleotidyltransferase n=1 Tax=Desulfotomaculum sp. 1211_IL3151 TaxID=3084055 RepID=UPI002FDB4BBD
MIDGFVQDGDSYMQHLLDFIAETSSQLNITTYLVGGAVRDLLLDRAPLDLDFIVTEKTLQLSQLVAEQYSGSLVILDEHREMIRVVTKRWQLDFSPLNNKTLQQDLLARDFTINAMALPIHKGVNGTDCKKKIFDPTRGSQDLINGLLRATASTSIRQDPLRVLRGLRFSAKLNLLIIPETMVLLRQGARQIEQVAGERVWHELSALFCLPVTFSWVDFMDRELHLWQYLLPGQRRMAETKQNYYHSENVWRHCLRTYQCLEVILKELSGNFPEGHTLISYFNQELSGGRSRIEILKLSALIHDVGKPDTAFTQKNGRISFHGHPEAGIPYAEVLAERLRLSRPERKLLLNLILHHMLPLDLYTSRDFSNLNIYRLFRSLADHILDILILSLADLTATLVSSERISELVPYRRFIIDLIEKYLKDQAIFNPKPYLSGHDLVKLGIPEGPKVGLLLEKLCEEQASGSVVDKESALRWVKKNSPQL